MEHYYSTLQGFPNPFLNHLVINNILKYIHHTSELKLLRSLCHQWRELTTPKLVERSMVVINSGRKMLRYLDTFPKAPIHKNFHLKVLQSLESEESSSFLQFILGQDVQAEELHLSKCVLRLKDVLKILKLGGSHLKTLSFNEVVIDLDDQEPINSEHSQSGSNEDEDTGLEMSFQSDLTRLEVTTCDEGESFPWTKVFAKTPKLQVLHAQLQSSEQVTALLESLLELENKPPIKEFSSFLIDLNTGQMHLLSCLNLPLTVLDLSVESSVSRNCIEEFLSTPNMRGLQNLKLFHETEENLSKMLLPRLDRLKSLELMGDPVTARIFANISKSCQNLRHLNLSQIENPEEILGIKFEHKGLISLSVEEGFLCRNVLSKLGQMFPNMKTLCLFLNDDNIPALFKDCKELEEIIVLGTELTDLGIIGVNLKGSSQIGDCKKLRKFSLYPQPQNRITDMSIYHGLMHVTELTFVELPETAITNEGLRSLLKSNPNLVRLSAKIAINPRTGEHSLRSTKYQVL